jgi:hypothetical protein
MRAPPDWLSTAATGRHLLIEADCGVLIEADCGARDE